MSEKLVYPTVVYAEKAFNMVNHDLDMVVVEKGTAFTNSERYPHIFEIEQGLYLSILAIRKNQEWFSLPKPLSKPLPPPERRETPYGWVEEMF
jgi:hypothetical protein